MILSQYSPVNVKTGVTPEEWRPVVGHEGYEVSSRGRVRSLRRSDPRILTPRPLRPRYPYQYVRLGAGRGNTRYVHQLVLEAFVGPRLDGHEVDHRDGDYANNNLENLQYVTHARNMQLMHARRTHCKRGNHPYDEHGFLGHRGDHRCRTCINELRRERKRHQRCPTSEAA